MTDNPYAVPNTSWEPPPVIGNSEARKIQVRPFSRFNEATQLMGDQYWLFVGICLLGVLIGSVVPMYILFGPMLCGIHLCFADRAKGVPTKLEQLFQGFEYFTPSLIAILLIVLILCVIAIPLFLAVMVVFTAIAASGDEQFAESIFMVGFLPTLFALCVGYGMLYVPFLFTFALIVDQRLSAWDAITASYRGAMKNFWGLVGLLTVIWIGTVASILACYIPLIFFLPYQFGTLYVVYRDIFPNASGIQQPE